MLNLTKEEKLVLVFIAACFIVGVGVNFYKEKFDTRETTLHLRDTYKKDMKRPFKIDINKASFKELMRLRGIGPETAGRIIDYREKNGSFFCEEDLMNVKGIGRAKFDTIKDNIVVE